MSLYKRGSTWWVSFTTPSGERIRCSAETSNRVAAQEFHDRLKTESWRVQKLDERPKYTWDDAGLKWLKETEHKKSRRDDISKMAWIQKYLRGRILAQITRDQLIELGERKKAEASGATANRYLALIRAILRKACYEWEWIDKVPKVKMYREAKRRVRWITPSQVQDLLDELPQHQRDLALFALATGLRQSNIVNLTWHQVDLQRGVAWIPADKAKGNEDIHVSLSEFAVNLLQRQLGKHPERVFTYASKPIGQINTKHWRAALERAGIRDFRWHDLRHTWTSWLVQNGTPLYDLQEMGGWKSAEMVRRYAHLAPAQLARHAEVVGKMLSDTNLAQRDRKPQ